MGANESVVNRGTVEWPHYERVIKKKPEGDRQKRDSESSESSASSNADPPQPSNDLVRAAAAPVR